MIKQLPSGWKTAELGNIVRKDRPISYGIVQTGDFIEGGVPCVRVVDLTSGNLKPDTMIRTTDKISSSYKRTILRKNEIMFALRGEIGTVELVPPELIGANLTRGIALISPEKDVDAKFLLWSLRSWIVREDIFRRLNGSTFKEIPLGELRKVQIVVPPLPEQRKIAEILSTWDEAIAQTERLLAALRERKKGLMQRLLSGQVRFAGFDGEWKEDDLGKFANVRRGASPRPISNPDFFAEHGRGWIRISDVTAEPTRFLNTASQYLSQLGESKSVKVEAGDLIMSICATIGVPKIVNIPACIHDGFVLFSEYEQNFNKEFLYHYIDFITAQLASGGQPGTQKNLNTEIVRKIKIPIISLAEQVKIIDVLNTSDEEIGLYSQKLAALQQQKKGLMQRLLTGQVRVKV